MNITITIVIIMLLETYHKKNIHKGQKYDYDWSDYNTCLPIIPRMIKHKTSMNKGVKYSCDNCDYYAN